METLILKAENQTRLESDKSKKDFYKLINNSVFGGDYGKY